MFRTIILLTMCLISSIILLEAAAPTSKHAIAWPKRDERVSFPAMVDPETQKPITDFEGKRIIYPVKKPKPTPQEELDTMIDRFMQENNIQRHNINTVIAESIIFHNTKIPYTQKERDMEQIGKKYLELRRFAGNKLVQEYEKEKEKQSTSFCTIL